MSNVIIFDRMQWRQGTAANLASVNEVLLQGEACIETDTGKWKVGDGATAWNSLDYLPQIAEDMPYNNGISGLTATDVQNAIDELAAGGGGGGGSTDPRTAVIDPAYDMLWKPPTTASAAAGASYPWVLGSVVGTVSVTAINGGASAPGVWRMSTGTGSTNCLAILAGEVPNIAVGAGEIVIPFRFRVPVLSDGTNTFTVRLGLADNFVTSTERIGVGYDHSSNGGALRLITTAASVTSIVNGSGGAVAANTWVSGRLEINAAGTQVDLYEGVTLIATTALNIPTGAMLLGALIAKSAGTTARTLDFDYLGPPQITFTTPR